MYKSLPSHFAVSIPVKPYVKRFLDINFGLPVDFTQNAHSHKHFQSLLKNPNISQDKKYPDHICTYTEIVEVVISEHDFYRCGWELTKTGLSLKKRFGIMKPSKKTFTATVKLN